MPIIEMRKTSVKLWSTLLCYKHDLVTWILCYLWNFHIEVILWPHYFAKDVQFGFSSYTFKFLSQIIHCVMYRSPKLENARLYIIILAKAFHPHLLNSYLRFDILTKTLPNKHLSMSIWKKNVTLSCKICKFELSSWAYHYWENVCLFIWAMRI